MISLNIGILAHVDAGKTSLTERLLFNNGVIKTLGSVDGGNTQTDSLTLERQRGITIKSAVTSFVVGGVTVNLIDTPGHPDFIAEVERVLSVLDGAILVVSAVEGVQAQTRVLMRALQRLRIPTIVFVNKIDRSGAQYEHTLEQLATKLSPAVVPMGTTQNIGMRTACFTPYGAHDTPYTSRLTDVLSEQDDSILAAYVDGAALPYQTLQQGLTAQTKQALVHPVFFGSAITGTGIDALVSGVTTLLPTTNSDAHAPVSGNVFKVERGSAGEKIAYVRLFSGTIRLRDQLQLSGDNEAKVTAISVYNNGPATPRPFLAAGQIGKLWGLHEIQIGDTIGVARTTNEHHFAPPSLETIVTPLHTADRGAVYAALTQLAEQDPLINVRYDEIRQETSVSLYGEVQKEVVQETLAAEYDLAVTFSKTTTICIERPIGTGTAVERGQRGDPFLATIGLRIEPGPVNTGVQFRLSTEVRGTMPLAFFTAVEDTVHKTLRQGLHGWQVTDCIVTMTHSGYFPRQSHAHAQFDKSMSSTGADFRGLTPLVLMDAIRQAGSTVYEPLHHFELEIPADSLSTLLPVLAARAAVAQTTKVRGTTHILTGDIPAAEIHELQQQLPALTSGEGILECTFDHYEPVRGKAPVRARTDYNPLNRKEYMRQLFRRS